LGVSADNGCQLCVMMRHALLEFKPPANILPYYVNRQRPSEGFAGSWVYLWREWPTDADLNHDTADWGRQPFCLVCEDRGAKGNIVHVGEGREICQIH
jgi:hypothetical protein